MRWGIRTQVLLTLALVLGFGLTVSYVVTTRITGSVVLEGRIERARQAAELAVGRFAGVPARGLAMKEGLVAMRELVAPDQIWLLGEDLRPTHDAPGAEARFAREVGLNNVAELAGLRPGWAAVKGPDGSRRVVVMQPLTHLPGTWLCLASSLEPAWKRVGVLDGLLLLSTMVLLGLTLVLGYVLLGRLVIRPLQRLQRPIERISAGEYTTTEPLKAGSREMAAVFEAFNRTAGRLAEDRRRIDMQISELKVANRELESAQEQLVLAEKLATTGTLAAGVAHEIGNPIAVLQGYLELLGEPDLTEDERESYAAAMNDAVARISTIIRDLLDFARPVDDSDRVCDAAEVVRTTTKLVEPQRRFRHVTVEVDLPDEAIPTAANEGRLEQVVLNLLFNAADASPEGGRVVVSARRDGDLVRLSVADDGPGIDKETMRRIFDPFFTTKDPGEGTGLGLAICHNIVATYHGRIRVETGESSGTTFIVELPAFTPDAAHGETPGAMSGPDQPTTER